MTTFPFERYLLDENVPYRVIIDLREQDINVKSVLELIPGSSDKEIISFANYNNYVVVTFDSDFGELIFREKLSNQGVLYFRTPLTSPTIVFEYIRKYFIKNHYNPQGKFITITKSTIRIRDMKE